MNIMTLDEATHTYRNSERPNMRFTSVTTVLESYHDEFDEAYHAARVAAREGRTPEEVIAEWKQYNDEASAYGTSIHHTMERYLLAPHRLYVPRNDFERTLILAFEDLLKKQKMTMQTNNAIRPEYIMYQDYTGFHMDPDQEAGLAGTADIIEDVDNDKFNIWDFKTNAKFTYDSLYDEWMFYPVNHMVYSKYNLYALQLAIYGIMYGQETGRRFNRGGLLYWDREAEVWELIPIPYMRREAEMLLQHFKMNVFPKVTLK